MRAKDVKRVCEGRYGWLNKAGLTNTKMQRRWCAVHELRLYYYENPRVSRLCTSLAPARVGGKAFFFQECAQRRLSRSGPWESVEGGINDDHCVEIATQTITVGNDSRFINFKNPCNRIPLTDPNCISSGFRAKGCCEPPRRDCVPEQADQDGYRD